MMLVRGVAGNWSAWQRIESYKSSKFPMPPHRGAFYKFSHVSGQTGLKFEENPILLTLDADVLYTLSA